MNAKRINQGIAIMGLATAYMIVILLLGSFTYSLGMDTTLLMDMFLVGGWVAVFGMVVSLYGIYDKAWVIINLKKWKNALLGRGWIENE